jgi:hypothetical protein
MAGVLRPEAIGSFILSWLIEQFLDDAARTERCFVEGKCSRSGWLWSQVFTLTAILSVKPRTELEVKQVGAWRVAVAHTIRLANEVLEVNTWEQAKEHLSLVAWEDGFEGEARIRQTWEGMVCKQEEERLW